MKERTKEANNWFSSVGSLPDLTETDKYIVVQTTDEKRKKRPLCRFFGENGTVFLVHTWQIDRMEKRKDSNQSQQQHGKHEHPLPQEISKADKERNEAAHNAADRDMENDAELTTGGPNDDLDEGESARLGEETSLI